MKNFDESLLSENGINVLDYLSDGSHQENFLEEVGRFGDQELSNAYKSLFDGDAKVIEKESDFKTLLDNNEHVKLVKECISKNKFSWLEKLLKKKEIDWFAEKMIAEIGNPKLIAQLISRKHLGWSAQNVIAEFNNDDWTAQIIKKQQDLSPYFKSYVITNCNDDILTEMVKKAFLSFDELELIVEKKRYFGIKEIVKKYKTSLPERTLRKIVELGNPEIIQLIGTCCFKSDDTRADIIYETGSQKLAEVFLATKQLGKLTQKAIVNLQCAELIRQMIKSQKHLIPLNICIAETLNLSLIKEFIGDYSKLSTKERNYIYSSGNSKMIRLVNTLIS